MWSAVLAVMLVAAATIAWMLYSRKSAKQKKTPLNEKFTIKDGITFFDNSVSPCARRVRTTLYEKKINHRVIDVDLNARENRHPSFLAINPLGKVPALVVRNVEGIPDCFLFESNAITEWLDEQFPKTIQLYPSDPWERAQVKMWQRWEMAMAEDFWPLLYANMSGFITRAFHSRSSYEKQLSSADPYQAAKLMKTYDDTLLTPTEKKSKAIRLFKWLDILENSLVGKKYLCGDTFTTADISVLPRIVLYPLVGFLITDKERRRYPNLIRYMEGLASRESIVAADRSAKMVNKWIPWTIYEWVGNWRSGKTHRRIYGKDIIDELKASPTTVPAPLPSKPSSNKAIVLYHHKLWPGSIMTRIACLELGIQTDVKEVNMTLLEHRSADYLALNPTGEVPTMCHDGRVIYDPMNITEYLDAIFSDGSGKSLLPDAPTDRVRMRMWHGWVNVCFNYQLIYLYKQYIVAAILKSQFSSEDDLLQVLHKSTTTQEYVSEVTDTFKRCDTASKEIESKMSPYKLALEKALEYLDKELSDREYLVGSHLSAADISVFSMVIFFKWIGLSVSSERYPNVAAWMERLTSVPSFSDVCNQVEEYWNAHGVHVM